MHRKTQPGVQDRPPTSSLCASVPSSAKDHLPGKSCGSGEETQTLHSPGPARSPVLLQPPVLHRDKPVPWPVKDSRRRWEGRALSTAVVLTTECHPLPSGEVSVLSTAIVLTTALRHLQEQSPGAVHGCGAERGLSPPS